MSQANVEVVQRGFEHFMATGEPHLESFHEEVEVHDHDTMDQGEYRGHAGLGRWLQDWSAAWSEFSMEPEEFLDAGDEVVMFVRMKATGVSTGLTLERQDAIVLAVHDGKVVHLDYYNNRADALKAVGIAG
jgi:ketosteroid isomerase-like protein